MQDSATSALSLTVLVLLGSAAVAGTPAWPEWRGPGGQGHAPGNRAPLTWSETHHVRWKTPLPGRGHSSPVIGDGRVWLTTAIETAASPEDAARRKLTDTGGQPLNILEAVSVRVLGVDAETGRLLMDREVLSEREPQWVHKQNTYASPTPVLEDGRLYVHFGAFGTAAIDTRSGETLWLNRELVIMHENGPGSSPIVWGDLVIVHFDGSDAQFLAAFHKATGRIAWKTARSGTMASHPQLRKSYGTPLVTTVRGRPLLLSPASDWLYAYDPATGAEQWKVHYGTTGFSVVPRPVLGHGFVYLATGFMRPEILAVTLAGDDPPAIAWRWKRGVPLTASPILVGDELYFVSDAGGMLTCLDARTGDLHYQERLGGNFAASPTHAAGRLYFHDRDGVTTVVKPGRTFEVLARNTLADPVQASAAVVDGALFLRTEAALYRLEEP